MLRWVIFDFDGVITNSEPVHFDALQQVLKGLDIRLDWTTYCRKYLAYDDRDLFRQVLRDAGREPDPTLMAELMARKNVRFIRALDQDCSVLPGVRELLGDLRANGIPAALCSGARRNEVEFFLRKADLLSHFPVRVTADEVASGKPDPQGYRQTLAALNANRLGAPAVRPQECVAIEDSPGGIRAAKAAGLHCLAVTNDYPAAPLDQADLVVENLTQVNAALLGRLAASG